LFSFYIKHLPKAPPDMSNPLANIQACAPLGTAGL
jgi:hypothetical protein